MSDIRAQSRRDSEFDRLVDSFSIEDFDFPEAMQSAYEMGKRHGREEASARSLQAVEEAYKGRAQSDGNAEREEGPAWHDAPTCAGVWVCTTTYAGMVVVPVLDAEVVEEFGTPRRWFGPIPTDEVKP